VKVFIAGGTGFVGVILANRFAGAGQDVTVMGQTGRRPHSLDGRVKVTVADGRRPGAWQDGVAASSLIINLAGASIFQRWTSKAKHLIRESRILTTRNIVDALTDRDGGVRLFSTSAVGYYGFSGDEELDETSPPGSDFLALLCRDWEAEAIRGRERGARVVITRFGIVLGRGGGALSNMLPLFRFFLGGPLGDGNQWFSWIHMDDILGALFHLLDTEGAEGAYNLTSPRPVRNRELAGALGKVLHRPAVLPAPGPLVRFALGEFGTVVLKGQRVLPARLLSGGYIFRHDDIEKALLNAV